jgi:hypothetical protein
MVKGALALAVVPGDIECTCEPPDQVVPDVIEAPDENVPYGTAGTVGDGEGDLDTAPFTVKGPCKWVGNVVELIVVPPTAVPDNVAVPFKVVSVFIVPNATEPPVLIVPVVTLNV